MKDDAFGNEETPDPALFDTKEDFGAGLRLVRDRAGLTVSELARVVGLPVTTVSDHCTGKYIPPPAVLRQELAACGITDPARIAVWLAARRGVRTKPGPRPAGTPAPYRGLERYRPEDAAWFCGRSRLTSDVIAQLREIYAGGGLLAVAGPSGSGKSSLLGAGLIPAVQAGKLCVPGSHIWLVSLFMPGTHPVRKLALELATATDDDQERPDRYADILLADPQASARLAAEAVATAGQAVAAPGGGARLLVVVDQFEEVFTTCADDQEQRAFIAALCALAGAGDGSPAALVVLGLRSDFFPRVFDYPFLTAAVARHQLIVGPMTTAELREAIIEPAKQAKLSVEDELVEVLLAELAPAARHWSPEAAHDAGALPLVSHALRATWNGAHGGRLTLAGYQATGGIKGAVAATAEDVYGQLTEAQQGLARQVFTRLVHIAPDTADTRRRVPARELPHPDGIAPVLDAFITARLITAEADDVQIAHEALLRAWPRLRDWIDADREGLPTHRQLTAAAEIWRVSGDPSDLYAGVRLADAEAWAAPEARYDSLNELEQEFLTRSVNRRIAEEKTARRRTRRLWQLIAALAAMATVAALLAVVAFQQKAAVSQQKDAVTQQRNLAVSAQVAIEADQLRSSDPALAMQLSLAAYQLAPTVEARASLLEATGGPLVTRLLGPAGAELNAVAYSPDHTLLATGSANGTVQLWFASRTGGPVKAGPPLPVPSPGSVTTIAFSPDGKTLVVGSSAGTVTEWDVVDPARPARLALLSAAPAAPAKTVKSVAFSPDSGVLAATVGDYVLLWNTSDPLHITALGAPLRTDGSQADAVAMSPDGKTLAAGTDGGQVLLWRLRSGAAPQAASLPQPPSPPRAVDAIAFSPDGHTLAAAGKAEQVWLWTLATGHRAVLRSAALTGPASFIYALAFSPDGQSLAAGSADSNAYIWNLASARVTATLPQPAPVLSVSFGGDSALATADADGAARVWHLPGPVLAGSTSEVFAVAYNPGGDDVAAGSGDGTVHLWDVSELAHPVALGRPLTSSGPAADALDGTVAWGAGGRLAAGTTSGGIRLWNVADPRHPVALLAQRSALTGYVQNVVFDATGKLMAVASAAGTIELWNTADFAHPKPLAVIRDVPPDSSQGVLAVSFDRGDRVLAAAGDDGSVRLWNIASRTQPKPLGSPLVSLANTVYQVTFSPDGSLLAESGEDRTVRLWQVADPAHPRLLATLTGPAGIVYDVAFSPDGRTLATSDGDKTVWLWDITDPARPVSLGSLTGPAQAVFAASFSPTGDNLVAGSQDGTVRLWLISPALAARYVCAIAGTPITPGEWARYVPGLPYRPPCPR
jgi:WD40 repeat protein